MNVLFTCAGRRTYLLKYFKENLAEGDKVVATDMQLSAPALQVADVKLQVPAVYDPEYVNITLNICKEQQIDVLLSLNDLELPILAENKARFEELGVKADLQSGEKKPRPDVRSFVLVWDRDELKRRIRLRTEQMLSAGWIEEAQTLIANGLLQTPTAWQALGYSLIGDFLNGKYTRNELADAIATATWQFARRQLTWFLHQHPEAEQVQMPFKA